jgi:murein DD-endopeptidase MepM/ murein hydrolase activator NlpD
VIGPYPELPFDPVTSAAAAEVQALYDAMKQVQALQNTIAAQETVLAARERELARADTQLAAALATRDRLGASVGKLARRLYTDRSAAVPPPLRSTPTRVTLLETIGVADPVDEPIEEYAAAARAVRRLEPAFTEATLAMQRSAAELAAQRQQLMQHEAAVATLRSRVEQNAAAALRSAPPTGPGALALPYVGGRLLRPVEGRLSSAFGNRFDPYFRTWQLHAGIDIAAPLGAPLRAAAGGRVVRAGWFGGYGNYTCIEHGRVREQRLTTCYAHQSQILVTAGQLVAAGDPIGRVGSTGASTGPHLHFEVRLGGRPVDPLPWL